MCGIDIEIEVWSVNEGLLEYRFEGSWCMGLLIQIRLFAKDH